MVNRSFCLSRKLMDLAECMGMRYANERVAVEPYDDGELTVICGVGQKTSKIGRVLQC